MTARCWKRLTWAVATLHIMCAVTFAVLAMGGTSEQWNTARPLGIATAVLAWLSFAAGERYRAVLAGERIDAIRRLHG